MFIPFIVENRQSKRKNWFSKDSVIVNRLIAPKPLHPLDLDTLGTYKESGDVEGF